MNTGNFVRICVLFTLLLLSGVTLAGIQVSGTRIVFPASDHEASLQVRNEGNDDIMIQSWIEAGAGEANGEIPFAITPSLARLSYRKQQTLRIFYQGKGLPEDRETAVWVSVQEIPQVSGSENSLQVAFRQRLKLFYRPNGLPGSADEAAGTLKWNILRTAGQAVLLVTNDSAFHVSFAKVSVIADQKEYVLEPTMIGPRGSQKMAIKGLPASVGGDAQVVWESINDYGALIDHKASIKF
ncbi:MULTISPECIES: molecular chaperone [unclassified Pseudomonas]|uniref:fimbrial biogenesis chaperone n=1 Tax=unclassified Pseudomonas TaxID=196821 RepID=UPI000A1DC525|nr:MULTISPECIES: fimbria/pilus periplasmic chaperone [unclassified Pseudomonas]UDI94637.1 fimbria/pilus periplasmic chaperone [Pseudomonas sp. IAC-BECa141]